MKKLLIILFFTSFILSGQNKPYVVLVSFDGFRHDYIERGITPNLTKIADEGVKASGLQPSFPSKTFPNHISIITGMYPEHHGIISNSFCDPFTGERYRLGDTVSVRESKWYRGEFFWETAKRQGIKTASFFWPGSEVTDENRRPDYYKKYEHEFPYTNRIDTVLHWLTLAHSDRPHFITTYFDAADTYGHKYGPDSEELNGAVKMLDSIAGYLYNGLDKAGMLDSVNIIFTADHGMTGVDPGKVIRIDKILEDYEVRIEGTGPLMMIYPLNHNLKEVYALLKKSENFYKVYMKEDVPEWLHFNTSPLIGEIVVIAEPGWTLADEKEYNRMTEGYNKGNHGYANQFLDMHGIFIARGPEFRNGYKTGTLYNVDIYPLLAKIFGVIPAPNIDGKPERINFILKEKENHERTVKN